MATFDEDGVPTILERRTYGRVYDLMVDSTPRWTARAKFTDASFGAVMRSVLAGGKPEAFLFPFKSAIPVADSVRGYYEALGWSIPDMSYVITRDQSTAYVVDGIEYDDIRERDVEQIRPFVEGRRVAIIEQYVRLGRTLKLASDIATEAGAVTVETPLLARWYNDALREDVDVDNLTSVHADHMRHIGRAVAELA
jgi:hypothetical protein